MNMDGMVTISDVTTLIDYLHDNSAVTIDFDAADCHIDGEINITDVATLVDYLLSGAW